MKFHIKYIVPLLLILFIDFNCISQDSSATNYQRIDYCIELDEISNFIENFGTTTDPSEIMKYIIFPDFYFRHMCRASIGYLPKLYDNPEDSTKKIIKEIEIIEYLDSVGCTNPLHFYQLKANFNREWRDSVYLNYPRVEHFYLRNEENRMEYLESFINEFNLPIDFSNAKINTARKLELDFEIIDNQFRKQVPSLRIVGYGFPIIEIYKFNGEYKVRNVSFFWE